MTTPSPKANNGQSLTAEERAQRLHQTWCKYDCFDDECPILESVTREIKLAQEDLRQQLNECDRYAKEQYKAYEETLETLKKIIENKASETILPSKFYDNGYAKGFSDGQVAMRSQIAEFVGHYRDEDVGAVKTHYAEDRILADRIRALKPKAPMGEGTARI